MFKELVSKAYSVHAEGYLNHYKDAFKNAHGAVSIGMIAGEAISILILIVVLVLIPTIGSAVEDNMPNVSADSAWADFAGSGASTFATVSPLITTAVIVVIVGLVLKVVYDLRRR